MITEENKADGRNKSLVIFTVGLVAYFLFGSSDLWLTVIMSGVIFSICFWFKGRKPRETVQEIATLLGIFGTFLGLVWALYGLDLGNPTEGIQDLLSGIYPAFLSSITGVFISLWVYFFPEFWKENKEELEKDSSIEMDILRELKKINEHIVGDSKNGIKMLNELKLVNGNMVGDSENSLSTQILELKDATTGKQDELKKSFDSFVKTMSDNNIKALSKAMEKVIKDFNAQLKEQFGENFKQLNEAVGDLLVWQKNYKDSIESTEKNLKKLISAIENSEKAIKASEGVINTSEAAMKTSSRVLGEIGEHAKSFDETSSNLKDNLNELRNLSGSVKEFAEQLDGKGEKISASMKEITNDSLSSLSSNMKSLNLALVRDYEKIFNLLQEINSSK